MFIIELLMMNLIDNDNYYYKDKIDMIDYCYYD